MTSQENPAAICPESTIESANRRNFIKKTALAATAASVGGMLLGNGNSIPASSARSSCCSCKCVVRAYSICYDAVNGSSQKAYGVYGFSCTLAGVAGFGATGVRAVSDNIGVCSCGGSGGIAIKATSHEGKGVSASSCGGIGVYGESETSCGLYGTSVSGRGVFGHSCCSIGVYGHAVKGGCGVFGQSGSGYGVQGSSASSTGVFGCSTGASGTGVSGRGKLNGVFGCSSFGHGVWGVTCSGFGVFGSATSSCATNYGVRGVTCSSHGHGVCGTATQAGGVGIRGLACCPCAIPIVARGASCQLGHLQQWQKGCSVLAVISAEGSLGLGGVTKPTHVLCISGKAHASSGFGIGPCDGINTTLTVNGSIAAKIRTVTTTSTLATTDYAILASGTITLTLPPADTQSGMMIFIKNTSTSTVSVVPGGTDSIEGATSSKPKTLGKQFDSLTLISNGTNEWFIQSGVKCGAVIS